MIICKSFKSHLKGSLQGFADLYIDKWKGTVRGCQLHMKDGKRWVNFPSKEYMVNGEKKYQHFFWFEDKETSDSFSEAAKKAIDLYCTEQRNNEINEFHN